MINVYNAPHATESLNDGASVPTKSSVPKHQKIRNDTPKGFEKIICLLQDAESLDDEYDSEGTNYAFAMALRLSKSESGGKKPKCEFRHRPGYNMNIYFLNPGNPDHCLPLKIHGAVNETKYKREGSVKSERGGDTVKFAGCAADSTSVLSRSDLRTYTISEATIHIFHTRNAFTPRSLMSCDYGTFCIAGNAKVISDTSGEVTIPTDDCVPCLRKVLFIQTFEYNLPSIGRLPDSGIEPHFFCSKILLKLVSNSALIECGSGKFDNGIYVPPSPSAQAALISISFPYLDTK